MWYLVSFLVGTLIEKTRTLFPALVTYVPSAGTHQCLDHFLRPLRPRLVRLLRRRIAARRGGTSPHLLIVVVIVAVAPRPRLRRRRLHVRLRLDQHALGVGRVYNWMSQNQSPHHQRINHRPAHLARAALQARHVG